MSDVSAGGGIPNLGDHPEPHGGSLGARLNWLRAAVLGANDGIVSTAGVVVGVAGATSDRASIVVAGVAAAAAGALSMAAGEYVSVSTQRDSERAMLHLERRELHEDPEGELEELTQLYQAKGIGRPLAEEVAKALTAHDALAAHAEVELGIDPDDLTNPWHAAWASMAAFTAGALLPLLVIAFSPATIRTWVTVLAVVAALALTGWTSARIGRSPARAAALRNVGGGVVAMAVTYAIGSLVGTTLA
ncbi:MAG: VIT family protein [Intrasporangium sp.]|uniref:VIT1/CCC1 transporter family protein n=1 Tax=Intrasporangium sp. TaxID=1925024 RepID=UPI002649719E|nr:VIT family protein [Intrasporangium sp.]MDN5796853.1 VIT family protein [Intrasporangium sp.]